MGCMLLTFLPESYQRGHNFSAADDAGTFMLGRGDFYVHPEFISQDELRFLRFHQEVAQDDAMVWEHKTTKCKPGAVRMYSDEEMSEKMTEEELSRLDDIRDRIASVANNIRI